MSTIPGNLKFTKNHEWIRLDSNEETTIGIIDYTQESLGDSIFLEFPHIGSNIAKG